MLSGPPVPIDSLLGEIKEWASDFRVVRDEVTVVASEAKELANLGWAPRGFPLSYAVKFTGVHTHLVPPNNHTQVFDLFLGKFTFGGLEVEVVVVQLL
jgi:hypothetical protein